MKMERLQKVIAHAGITSRRKAEGTRSQSEQVPSYDLRSESLLSMEAAAFYPQSL